MRRIIEAILYVLRSGCPWRLLPDSFPPWGTVYGWFLPAAVIRHLPERNRRMIEAGRLKADSLRGRDWG